MILAMKKILLIGIPTLMILVIMARAPRQLRAQAAQSKAPSQNIPESARFLGAVSCASSNCHGSPNAKDPKAKDPAGKYYNVRQDEYFTWIKFDKHSKAYEVLGNELSKTIARNLGLKAAHQSERCLTCHALDSRPGAQAGTLDLSQGISCEACHGRASGWRDNHTEPGWRNQPSAVKAKAGLTALSNPLVRAETCLGCHLGSAKNNVDHEMLAAGHPDLRFELDNFADRMPRHWFSFTQRQDKTRRQESEYSRAWIIGQAVAFQKSLARLAERAKQPSWPEFAELDCFACHHSLKDSSWRQANATKTGLGLPKWSQARFVMVRHIIAVFAPDKLPTINADADELANSMVASTVDGSRTAAIAMRLEKSLAPIVKELDQKLERGVDAKQARQFVDLIVKDLPYLMKTDIRSAEQAAFAVNSLVSDIARTSSDSNRKELAQALESIVRHVETPERFDPATFGKHMQDLQKVLTRQGGAK